MRSPNPRFLHGPFLVGDMDWPLSGWGYGLAPFWLGIWTGPFPIDMDRSLSCWGYGPTVPKPPCTSTVLCSHHYPVKPSILLVHWVLPMQGGGG